MLIKIATTKDKSGRRLATCRPTDPQSTRILSNFYPDAAWLEDRPFDTEQSSCFAYFRQADRRRGQHCKLPIPPVPYAKTRRHATAALSFRIAKATASGHQRNISVTQLTLLASALDPAIIDEERDVYLGVGPAEKLRCEPTERSTRSEIISAFFCRRTSPISRALKLSSRQLTYSHREICTRRRLRQTCWTARPSPLPSANTSAPAWAERARVIDRQTHDILEKLSYRPRHARRS